MTLSASQKLFFKDFINFPEQCEQQIKNDPLLAQDFVGKYDENGYGLIHHLINSFLKYNHASYWNMIEYVLTYTPISLNDKKNKKSLSAFDIFLKNSDSINSLTEEQKKLYFEQYISLVKLNGNKGDFQQYVAHLNSFFQFGYTENVNNLIQDIDYGKEVFSDNEELIKNLILYSSPTVLKIFFQKYPLIKNHLSSIGFGQRHSQYYDKEEYSNMLVFALRYQRPDMAKYLLKHHKTPMFMKGEVNSYNSTSTKKNIFSTFSYAISEAVKNDVYEVYEQILEKMTHYDLLSYLLEKRTLFDDQKTENTCAMFYIVNHAPPKYVDILLVAMEKMLNDKNTIWPIHTHAFMANVLSIVDLTKMKQILDICPDYLFKSDYLSHTMLNEFWDNIFSNPLLLKENEHQEKLVYIEQIIEIYQFFQSKQAVCYMSDKFYHINLLKNPVLLQKLIDVGMNLSQSYCRSEDDVPTPLVSILNNYSMIKELNEHPDDYAKSISIIYKKTANGIEHKYYHTLLNKILETKSTLLMNLLTKEDVAKNDMLSYLPCLLYYSDNQFFISHHLKLLSLGLDLFKKIQNKDQEAFLPIYTYLFHLRKNEIEYVFNHYNPQQITMNTLSKNSLFWDNVGELDVWEYIKEKGANFNQQEMSNTLSIQEYSPSLHSYFEYGGVAPSLSVVNFLFIYENYKKLHLISQFHPSLFIQKNEQGQYLMNEIVTKLIKKSIHHKDSQILYNIVLNIIQYSVLYKEQDLLKKLEHQLSKSLIKKFPDILKYYSYQKLQFEIEEKEIIRKPKL